jgi:T5SS/PEP-CTERM-associated repeat protein
MNRVMKFLGLALPVVALVAMSALPNTAWATITVSGDVSPAAPGDWPGNIVFIAANSGTGAVTVNNTAPNTTVSTAKTYVGYADAGSLAVTGAGASWTCTDPGNETGMNTEDSFVAGAIGAGTVNISSQATLSTYGAVIQDGSTMTVSGNSTWTVAGGSGANLSMGTDDSVDPLGVGNGGGTGVLNITTGGTVNVGNYTYIAHGSAGTVTVNGAGSLLNSASHIIMGSGSVLKIESSGTVVTGTTIDTSGGGTVYFDGGKLKAVASGAY